MNEVKIEFEVSEPLRVVMNSFRLTTTQHDAIKQLAHDHNIQQADVVRQMIDFALKHMKPKDRP